MQCDHFASGCCAATTFHDGDNTITHHSHNQHHTRKSRFRTRVCLASHMQSSSRSVVQNEYRRVFRTFWLFGHRTLSTRCRSRVWIIRTVFVGRPHATTSSTTTTRMATTSATTVAVMLTEAPGKARRLELNCVHWRCRAVVCLLDKPMIYTNVCVFVLVARALTYIAATKHKLTHVNTRSSECLSWSVQTVWLRWLCLCSCLYGVR